jgi:hypothetical protein
LPRASPFDPPSRSPASATAPSLRRYHRRGSASIPGKKVGLSEPAADPHVGSRKAAAAIASEQQNLRRRFSPLFYDGEMIEKRPKAWLFDQIQSGKPGSKLAPHNGIRPSYKSGTAACPSSEYWITNAAILDSRACAGHNPPAARAGSGSARFVATPIGLVSTPLFRHPGCRKTERSQLHRKPRSKEAGPGALVRVSGDEHKEQKDVRGH